MKRAVDKRRTIVIVIDGCGIGAAPDAARFGDSDRCNTLANVALAVGGLYLPNLAQLGLGNIHPIEGVAPVSEPQGFYGKLKERSCGKDTQTGHWELMGLISETAFPTYPHGFPEEIIDQYIHETDCGGILGNKAASGTQIIEELGPEHERRGYPIVYTSADSVFQVACHIDMVPLDRQYEWCRKARAILAGKHRVGRVICRPFTGSPGSYRRLSGQRRDYAVPPPAPTLLDVLQNRGDGILGIGKIEDIFDRRGITHAVHTGSNHEGLELTLKAVEERLDLEPLAIAKKAPKAVRMIFTNLVDTDMLFGHRRDVQGYARALLEFDEWLGRLTASLKESDLLILSSDHGNDPTASGTDHTREMVPVLAYAPAFAKVPATAKALGVLDGFMDVAASIASWLRIPWSGPGISFLPELSRVG